VEERAHAQDVSSPPPNVVVGRDEAAPLLVLPLARRIWSVRHPFRVALGSAFWLAACGALLWAWPSISNTLGLLVVLGGWGASTYALGYYVRSWGAILAPAAIFVLLEVALIVVGTHGDASGAALLIWLVPIFFAPYTWLLALGIKRGERAHRSQS
jgi:hypothetical protein